MAGKDWFGGWAVLASFAAIAGATFLTGKSRSRVESSDKRLKLAHGFFVEASRALDTTVRDASLALDRYAKLADRRDKFEEGVSSSKENPQKIADIRRAFAEDLESLKEEFQDLDRAADLAYRWREEAAYELDMARRGPEAEYPVGHEFSEAFESSYGRSDDVLHAKGLRGHAHREAQKMLAKGKLIDPADYIDVGGELYDADAVNAAVSVVRALYGSDLKDEKFGSPKYMEYLYSVLVDEDRKRGAEEIWSDYGFAPESEKVIALRRSMAFPVESVLDSTSASLRAQQARAKARKRSDRYRNPVRSEDILIEQAPVEPKPAPKPRTKPATKSATKPLEKSPKLSQEKPSTTTATSSMTSTEGSSTPVDRYADIFSDIENHYSDIEDGTATPATQNKYKVAVRKLALSLRKDPVKEYIDKLSKMHVDIHDKQFDPPGALP